MAPTGSLPRAMILPFLMALFPSLWFVNRNVTSDVLPPAVEPTAGRIAGALALAVLGSVAVAIVAGIILREFGADREGSWLRRVVHPDDETLRILALLLVVVFAWATVALGGVGPDWLEYAFWPVMIVVGLPFLLLAPLAIGSWVWVVLGLALCAVWLSVLSVGLASHFSPAEGRKR